MDEDLPLFGETAGFNTVKSSANEVKVFGKAGAFKIYGGEASTGVGTGVFEGMN